MDGRVAAFIGVALLLTITPGVDMALVTRQGLAHGRQAALRTTLGVNTGVFCWGVLSAVGVATLLERSAAAFETLRWAGAAYLIWLGVQRCAINRIIRSARSPYQRRFVPSGRACSPTC